MCRTAVAIIRGGKWWGDWWQRPQFVANLFSPSIRSASSSRTLAAAEELGADEAEAAFDGLAGGGAAIGVVAGTPAGMAGDADEEVAGTAAGVAAVLPFCRARADQPSKSIPTVMISGREIKGRRIIGYLHGPREARSGTSDPRSRCSCFPLRGQIACRSC